MQNEQLSGERFARGIAFCLMVWVLYLAAGAGIAIVWLSHSAEDNPPKELHWQVVPPCGDDAGFPEGTKVEELR